MSEPMMNPNTEVRSLTLGDAIVAWVMVAAAHGVSLSPALQAVVLEHGTTKAADLVVRDLDRATVEALRYAIDNAPPAP